MEYWKRKIRFVGRGFCLAHRLRYFKNKLLSISSDKILSLGDTINKSEEHIWKHINGKWFLNMLEKKEAEKVTGGETKEEEEKTPNSKQKEDHVKEKKKEKKKNKKGEEEKKKEEDNNNNGKANSAMMNSCDKEFDPENGEFWMPPLGERWDMDDGGDRWGSGSVSDAELEELEHDNEVANGEDETDDDDIKEEACELSRRTKWMSIEIGPSSFASTRRRKKKNEATEAQA